MRKQRLSYLKGLLLIVLFMVFSISNVYADTVSNEEQIQRNSSLMLRARSELRTMAIKNNFEIDLNPVRTRGANEEIVKIQENEFEPLLINLNKSSNQQPSTGDGSGPSSTLDLSLRSVPIYTTNISHPFTRNFGPYPFNNYRFRTTGSVSYMLFQGLPRFSDANNINISAESSGLTWDKTGSEYINKYFVKGYSFMEFISDGRFVLDLDVGFSGGGISISVPVRIYGQPGKLIDMLEIIEVL